MRKLLILYLTISFIVLIPYTGSATSLPDQNYFTDPSGDWEKSTEKDKAIPSENLLKTIDIRKIGYSIDQSTGMIDLTVKVVSSQEQNAHYQLEYLFKLDLTLNIFLQLDCIELTNPSVKLFSNCKITFWEENDSRAHSYFNMIEKDVFQWDNKMIRWKLNLGDALNKENKTNLQLDDLVKETPTLKLFDSSKIDLPLLSVTLGLYTEDTDIINDYYISDQESTTFASQYWRDNWGYYAGSIALIAILVVIWKREAIITSINNLRNKNKTN